MCLNLCVCVWVWVCVCVCLASPIGKLAPMSAVPAGAVARFPLYCTYLTVSTISHTVREYICMYVQVVVSGVWVWVISSC